MKIAELNGFEFHLPTTSGKAGKGHAKTSNIQVRQGGFILKQFKFIVGSEQSRRLAMRKAREFARW